MTSTTFKSIAITIAVGIVILVGADLLSGWIAAKRNKASTTTTTDSQ